MSNPTRDFLDALRWHLHSLRLAGVKRVPRLFPSAEAPGVGASDGAAAPPGATRSWAEAARYLKEHIDTEGAKWARTQAAGASAGRQSGGSRAAASGEATPRGRQTDRGASPGGRIGQAGQVQRTAGPAPDLRPTAPLDAETAQQLADLAATVSRCTRCPELVASRTQTVFCDGPGNADLMFIGEAPGEDEDRQGVAFVGRAGQLLTKIIVGGMRMRREDVYICNILKCRPPGNRNPAPQEAANCREYLDRQIDLVRPKVICLLGGVASRFLLDDPTPVGKMRGKWFEYRGVPVRVTYHPAYLLRSYTQDTRQKVWDDVLKVADKLKALRSARGGPRDSATGLF